jgi:hypothetical protein
VSFAWDDDQNIQIIGYDIRSRGYSLTTVPIDGKMERVPNLPTGPEKDRGALIRRKYAFAEDDLGKN